MITASPRSSHHPRGRLGQVLRLRPPQVQAKWVLVDVEIHRRMIFDAPFIWLEEKAFHVNHFLPRRAAVPVRYADMIPSAAAAGDGE